MSQSFQELLETDYRERAWAGLPRFTPPPAGSPTAGLVGSPFPPAGSAPFPSSPNPPSPLLAEPPPPPRGQGTKYLPLFSKHLQQSPGPGWCGSAG